MINRDLIQIGNDKLGKEVAVINLQAAHDCSSAKEGLCPVVKDCYARKIEVRFKKTLERNRRQEQVWDSISAPVIADMIAEAHKKYKILYVRYNVFGDVRNQDDIEKIQDIAEECRFLPIAFYLYTRRVDLKWFKLANVVINLSAPSTDKGEWLYGQSDLDADNTFSMLESVEEYPYWHRQFKNSVLCNGDCRLCKLCMTKGDKYIWVIKH